MKKYIVYKTINLVNGKYYIGKHKVSSDYFDGYFGSSEVVNNAIEKYVIESFERITLCEFDNEDECFLAEEKIIGDLWKTDKNCYNKQPGGKGFSSGNNHYTQGNGFSKKHKENLKIARKNRLPHSEETKRKMSESRKGSKRTIEQRKNMSRAQSGKNNPMYGKTHSEEKKKEIGKKLQGKYTGENSSAFKGYYVTPFGKFSSIKEAAEKIDVVGKGTIRSWCLNENKKITKNMIGISKYLTNCMLGKTLKEIGFYFEVVK
jgi:group I intron endonuclease